MVVLVVLLTDVLPSNQHEFSDDGVRRYKNKNMLIETKTEEKTVAISHSLQVTVIRTYVSSTQVHHLCSLTNTTHLYINSFMPATQSSHFHTSTTNQLHTLICSVGATVAEQVDWRHLLLAMLTSTQQSPLSSILLLFNSTAVSLSPQTESLHRLLPSLSIYSLSISSLTLISLN